MVPPICLNLVTLPIPRVFSQFTLSPVYIGLLGACNNNVFRSREKHLAIHPCFCDKFGSSEMIAVRTLFFPFCVLKSSPRERGVVLPENQQIFNWNETCETRPTLGAAPCLVFQCGACWSLRQSMGLEFAPLFVRSPGLSYTKEHP